MENVSAGQGLFPSQEALQTFYFLYIFSLNYSTGTSQDMTVSSQNSIFL